MSEVAPNLGFLLNATTPAATISVREIVAKIVEKKNPNNNSITIIHMKL